MINYDRINCIKMLQRSINILQLLSDYGLPVEPIIDWSKEGWEKGDKDFVNAEMNKARIIFDTFVDGSHDFNVLERYFNSFWFEGTLSDVQALKCITEMKQLFPLDLSILESR